MPALRDLFGKEISIGGAGPGAGARKKDRGEAGGILHDGERGGSEQTDGEVSLPNPSHLTPVKFH